MSDLDLDRLAAIAEAATPGSWIAKGNDAGIWIEDEDCAEPITEHVYLWPDATFIAAFSPDVVAELIAAAKERDNLRADNHPDILSEIEERRTDEAFMERIRTRVAEDADLLQRIGEDELFIADIRARLSQAEAERDNLRDGIKALADGAVFADFGEYHPDGDGNEEIVLGVREADIRALLGGGSR